MATATANPGQFLEQSYGDDYDDEETMDEAEEEPLNSGFFDGGGVRIRELADSPRTSELTLSFEGEVYVFPSVTPEKVWNFGAGIDGVDDFGFGSEL